MAIRTLSIHYGNAMKISNEKYVICSLSYPWKILTSFLSLNKYVSLVILVVLTLYTCALSSSYFL